MLLPSLLADGGDRFVPKLCPRVLVFESLGDPSDQNIINAGKDTAVDDILRRHFGENRLAVQGAVNALGDLIETLAVKIAVHQVIQKGDDIARFIRHKRSPRLRHIGVNAFGDIGHEHRDDELFQGRFVILIPENAVRLLPKGIQQIVLFKFGEIGILLQRTVGQQTAHHFFKGCRLALTENAHQGDLDRRFVKGLDLQIIERLRSCLIGKKLYVMLDDGLIPLINAEVEGKQRSTVGEKFPGILHRVGKVVILYGRLRKGRIHKIALLLVHALQKVFDIELVVRFQMQDLGVFQRQSVHILFEFGVSIVPKDELPHLARKLPVQLVGDLFQVQLCHMFLTLFSSKSPGSSRRRSAPFRS